MTMSNVCRTCGSTIYPHVCAVPPITTNITYGLTPAVPDDPKERGPSSPLAAPPVTPGKRVLGLAAANTLAIGYTIRPARATDSRFLYELAMDPRIRSMSTRSEEFTFEEHERWYAEKRGNGLNAIWVMEVGDIPVGQVRYGCASCDMFPTAEIAISVVPSQQKRGYATALLQETMPLARELLKVDRLVALVLRKNYASRRLFRRVGFRFVRAECRMDKMHARYEAST